VPRLCHLFAAAALTGSGAAAASVPLPVNVNQLMGDEVALHGVAVATASSDMRIGRWTVSVSHASVPVRVNVGQLERNEVALQGVTVATATSDVRIGRWTVSASQSFLHDNVLTGPRAGREIAVADLRQKVRRGFGDLSLSAQRSYSLAKRLRLDLTIGSTIPMAGPFGTRRLDNDVDAMVGGDIGSTSYWVGVTQHRRTGGPLDTRRDLTELYGGLSRSFGDLTSVRLTYYRAQSDKLDARQTRNMSLSLDHDLRDLGHVGFTASRSINSTNPDKGAAVSLELDKLPF